MARKMTRVLNIMFGLSLAPACLAMGGGPKTHNECLQKFLKSAESLYASSAIQQACNLKFTKQTNTVYADCLLKNSDDILTAREYQTVVKECRQQEVESILDR